VPTIDFTDDELAAVTAAVRRAIEGDRYPHAPRLDPLRAAQARLDAATKSETVADLKPKAPPPAKARQAGAAITGAHPDESYSDVGGALGIARQ